MLWDERVNPRGDPLSRGFGIPNRSPDPLRERDVARRMRQGWPAIPGQKNTGIEPHPAHVFPTAERLQRLVPPRWLGRTADGLYPRVCCPKACHKPKRRVGVSPPYAGPRAPRGDVTRKRRCTDRPSVIYWLSMNFSLSLPIYVKKTDLARFHAVILPSPQQRWQPVDWRTQGP